MLSLAWNPSVWETKSGASKVWGQAGWPSQLVSHKQVESDWETHPSSTSVLCTCTLAKTIYNVCAYNTLTKRTKQKNFIHLVKTHKTAFSIDKNKYNVHETLLNAVTERSPLQESNYNWSCLCFSNRTEKIHEENGVTLCKRRKK